MHLNTVNLNNTPEEDIKFLFKKYNKFFLPDRLRKIHYNRTSKYINQNTPWFSIHSSTIERTCIKKIQHQEVYFWAPHFQIILINNKYTYIIWKIYLKILT